MTGGPKRSLQEGTGPTGGDRVPNQCQTTSDRINQEAFCGSFSPSRNREPGDAEEGGIKRSDS